MRYGMRMTALVVVAVVAVAALADEPTKSGKGTAKTKFTFTNANKVPVEVFWVDEQGKEHAYGKVEAGQSHTYDTYSEHLWRFKIDGKVVANTFGGKGPMSAFTFLVPEGGGGSKGMSGGEKMEKSWDGKKAVEVTFQNRTGKEVELFWVDTEGKEQSYDKIAAGKDHVQKTTSSHLWRIKQGGKVIHTYRAGGKAKQTDEILADSAKVGGGEKGKVVTGSDFSAEEAEELLAYHNKVRKEVSVDGLKWSATLSKFAQEWADHLAATGKIEHRPRDGSEKAQKYGENIAFNGTALKGAESWYSEKPFYKSGTTIPKDFGSFKAGHYTQMVWKNTKQLGAGKAVIKQGTFKGLIVLVANYDPPGNYYDQKPY